MIRLPRATFAIAIAALLAAPAACKPQGENPSAGEGQQPPTTQPPAPAPATPSNPEPSAPPPAPKQESKETPPPAEPSKPEPPPLPPDAWFYERKPPKDIGKVTSSGVKVYSNEDLEKLGPIPPRAEDGGDGTAEAQFGKESLERENRDKASSDAAAKLREQTEQRIAELQAELDRLNQRDASLRNPFLAHVQTTEKEQQEEAGMDAVARLKVIDMHRQQLQAEIEKERVKLASYTPQQ